MEYFKEDFEYLKVDSGHIEKYIEFINSSLIKNIAINSHWGYKTKNIDFVKFCPNIERLFIVDADIDISEITSLEKLLVLVSSSNPNSKIDLSKFNQIEEVRIDDHKNWINIDCCSSLRSLRLDGFKGKDLQSLLKLKNLQSLTLASSNIESLNGLECFKYLKTFKGYNLRKLISFDIERKFTSLKHLTLENCKKIKNYQEIINLISLERLSLINCADLDNIDFIKKLSKLNDVRISHTNVKNGNMNPLKGVEKIFYTNKRHFTPKFEEMIKERLK